MTITTTKDGLGQALDKLDDTMNSIEASAKILAKTMSQLELKRMSKSTKSIDSIIAFRAIEIQREENN